MDELLPWMPWPKEHGTVEGSEASERLARVHFLERTELRMHLYLKGTGTLVGSSGLTQSTVRGIAALAFETLGAKRGEIRCEPLNRPSARLAERAGFRLEGELRNDALGTDGWNPAQHAPLLRHTARSRRTALVTHYRQDKPKGL